MQACLGNIKDKGVSGEVQGFSQINAIASLAFTLNNFYPSDVFLNLFSFFLQHLVSTVFLRLKTLKLKNSRRSMLPGWASLPNGKTDLG